MKPPLNILHLEDNDMDAAMVEAMLANEGIVCTVKQVCGRREFKAGLADEELDIILSDFSMPGFDGLTALDISRAERPEVPFIFISGTLGEELAVQALLEGATDYVLKDRMMRLPNAIRRALTEKETRQKRRQSEEALRESEERFRLMMESVVDTGILVCDVTGKILYWNPSATTLYGWGVVEALGQDAGALLHRNEEGLFKHCLEQTLATGHWSGELTKSGKDGQKRVIQSRWSLMRTGNGTPQSVLVVDNDVTEKKRLEAEALRTQRVETIGALAGGIAHDLNNALTPVLMGVKLLERETLSPEGRGMVALMGRSALRGSEMVNQILSFSRGVGGQQMAIELRKVVEEMARLAEKTFPGSIKITTSIPDRLHLIRGNATQLHQVLLNLCVNARDAMPKGGCLAIEALNVTLNEEFPAAKPGAHQSNAVAALNPMTGKPDPGTYVLLKVSDTGQGIAPELLAKIFQPFFSTKELGRGTGLGLSTVLGIVKTHGGFVDVVSQEGRGTTFRVYLPSKKTVDSAGPDARVL